ncbi:AraC family transcriptional regulator [Acuticoccus sediminis]|uniref:AraC family transcriptional regulator n=1 Tax=Acuticoccus sediminis TaxID=2184697 RepID=A0A8B2NWC9_9HYPH|nr:AraC family transcriptional regulator [Acuticoccus sediminis]RAI01824.1 AraC family transcriptional regulator [Acuticoccus sediminis]
MDPLSDVLMLLKPRSYVSAGFEAGGAWLLAFPPYEGIKVNAVLSGSCWLAMGDGSDPVRLREGDCFILPKGRPFRLGSDLGAPPVDAGTVFGRASPGGVAALNGGADFVLAGSRFSLDAAHADILLDVLPSVVLVEDVRDREELRWILTRMRREVRERLPGGDLVAQHLAHLMLVQALRLYLEERAGVGVGWLYALADRRIGSAIGAIHAEPARRWTVQQLAERAGMSRTAFAVRFKAMVGRAPMDYLTRWRMALAADRLETSGDAIPAIAASLGYDSESAFGAAFKRVMGASPRQHGRRRRPSHTASPPPASGAP